MTTRSKSESGQAMLEFAIVSISLTFLFAGAFTVGAMMNKALQVSNVTRSAAVLMVRQVTDPSSNMNMKVAANQQILMREATGLGMSTAGTYTPSATGNGAIFLSKVILVGANECAAGVTPIPSGVPPWSTASCANYGSYVFDYYVAIGNNTRWSSVLGTPSSALIEADGTVSAQNLATNTTLQVPTAAMTAIITLAPGTPSPYALIVETFADVSSVSVFSVYKPPVIYYRTVT
jgi:hypothetical protein